MERLDQLSALSIFQTLKSKMVRLMEPLLAQAGLTPLQGYVLLLLSEGEATVGQVSSQTRMGQANTSALCKKLEQAGMLTRTRSPRDGRVVTLELTPQGSAAVEQVRRGFARYRALAQQLPHRTQEDLARGVQAAEQVLDYLYEQTREDGNPSC